MSVISISKLNFGYQKSDPILQELSMEVPKGSIYGFLGANGAGKSTTIRNVLGLLKPRSGSISLFGKELQSVKPSVFGQIGSLIESPSLYPNLSAADNLKIACKYQGVSTVEIEKVLEKIGLLDQKKKAVKKYSMGMKQRLGLGMALIHDPQLLILDEPTNGLDPNGITEIRGIITQLCNEGKTIMLSSHLLSEIDRIATHVGIIKDGKMIFEGTLKELNEKKSVKQSVQIKTNDIAKTKSILSGYSILHSETDHIQVGIGQARDVPALIRKIVGENIDLYEVKLIKNDLEKMFMSITNNRK